jgi:hypothetical protein
MDPAEQQILQTLLGGADQGAARVVTLATTAAATALWTRLRSHWARRAPSLDSAELSVLATQPGQEIDLEYLRRMLQKLPASELRSTITVYGDYVNQDKNVNYYGGNWS